MPQPAVIATLGRRAVCCAVLLPLIAAADDLRLSAVAGVSLTHFSYKEFSDAGAVLDREAGFIPGFALRLAQSGRDCAIAQDVAYGTNDVAHDGRTNTGTPFTSRTDEAIADVSVRFGCTPPSMPRYSAYTGLGYTHWKRDIHGGARVAGLRETYSWWYAMLGGRAVLVQGAESQLAVDLRLIRTISPTLKVDFNGLFDTTTLGLGERTGVRLSLPWRLTVGQAASVVVEPFHERLRLGRSRTQTLTRAGAVAGEVFEPRGELTPWGVTISWALVFY